MGIIAKLLKAQSEIGSIKKDGKNPHFKSNYATLPNVLSEVLPVLQDNDIMFSTKCEHNNGSNLMVIELIDVETNEIRSTTFPMIGANTMQGIGQAHTYAMRYGILSLLGLCPEIDDDGNNLSGIDDNKLPNKNTNKVVIKPSKTFTYDEVKELYEGLRGNIPVPYSKRFLDIFENNASIDADGLNKAGDYLTNLKNKK